MAARITGVLVVIVAGIILTLVVGERQKTKSQDPPRPDAAWVDCICSAVDGDNMASITARCQVTEDDVILTFGNGWCE